VVSLVYEVREKEAMASGSVVVGGLLDLNCLLDLINRFVLQYWEAGLQELDFWAQ